MPGRQQRRVGAGLKVIDSATLVDASTGVQYGGGDTTARAWAYVAYDGAGVPTLGESVGVDSIGDGGTGILTIVWDTPFATAMYTIVATPFTGGTLFALVTAMTAAGATIRVFDTAGTLTDPTAALMFVAFGRQ